jgi:hypothetical protein
MLLLEIDGSHSVTSAALDSGFSHFGKAPPVERASAGSMTAGP